MKKIMALIVSWVLMVSIMPIKINASDVISLGDITWNDNVESDPWDDTLSFKLNTTYPYTTSTTSTYEYNIIINNNEIILNNQSVVVQNGTATVNLKSCYELFGSGYNYTVKIRISNLSDNTVIAESNAYTKNYSTDTFPLTAPSNPMVKENIVTFSKTFGASYYEISRYQSDGITQIGTTISFNESRCILSDVPSSGEYVKIVAVSLSNNVTTKSDAASYQIPAVTSLGDLTFNGQNTVTPNDDEIEVSPLTNYPYNTIASYYYKIFINANGENLLEYNCSFDTSSGKIKIALSKCGVFGYGYDYIFKVLLFDSNGVKIAESNSYNKSYTAADIPLTAPANPVVNQNSVKFSKVFGATKYEVCHYKSDGITLIEDPIEYMSLNITLKVAAVKGDVVTIASMNDDTKSDAVKVVVSESASISNLTWETMGTDSKDDDELTFLVPEDYLVLDGTAYNYKLQSVLPFGSYIYLQELTTENSSIDATNKTISIHLNKIDDYQNYADFKYRIYLYKTSSSQELCSSEYITKSFPVTSLTAPTNIRTDSTTGYNTLLFDPIYGATEYDVIHYDSTGTIVKEASSTLETNPWGPNTARTYLSDSVANDVVSVTAKRIVDNEVVLTSPESRYVIGTVYVNWIMINSSNNIKGLTSNLVT